MGKNEVQHMLITFVYTVVGETGETFKDNDSRFLSVFLQWLVVHYFRCA